MTDRFAVLAVCTANICRSPMIEMMLRAELDPDRFEVASAGVKGWPRHPMDRMAELELRRYGLEPGAFRSHPIDTYLVESANLILTAERSHRSRVLEDEPRALRWTFTLREFAGLCDALPHDVASPRELVAEAARRRQDFTGDPDIGDPYRRAPQVHRDTADAIHDAVGVIARRLNDCTS